MTEQIEGYRQKRDFGKTPEPSGAPQDDCRSGPLRFVVQKHDATRLHFDLRLEHDGVYKSWAVTNEPSTEVGSRRLAVQVEDHSLEYGTFEGVIPEGEYGAGSVIIWDSGTWTPEGDPDRGLRDGKLNFELAGSVMQGRWTLVRFGKRSLETARKDNWLLIKRHDTATPRAATGAAKPAVAQNSFAGWTNDRQIRHAVVHGLREDKDAKDVVLERSEGGTPVVQKAKAVRLSNPDKLLFTDPPVTKRDLATYWKKVAPLALPYIGNRPLSLLRCPDGIDSCFHQKHIGSSAPDGIVTTAIDEGEDPYAMVDGESALIGLVQWGTIELHAWGSRADDIEHPDTLVFDLDPSEELPWSTVVDAAEELKSRIEAQGLVPFAKLTGGKGLHLVVPIVPGPDWDAVKTFTQALATELVEAEPDRFTVSIAKAKRSGKIFIDYLRNAREATSIALYSPRAREGAPIAVPIAWSDLLADRTARPIVATADLTHILRSHKRSHPWKTFEESRRTLPA